MNNVETPTSLSPCPRWPNCVSSEGVAGRHFIEPYILSVDSKRAWQELKAVIEELPRTSIKTINDQYLHAESKSRLLGFVDDVEFLLLSEENWIAIRSASRTGLNDLGVNRRRLEIIRKILQERKVIT